MSEGNIDGDSHLRSGRLKLYARTGGGRRGIYSAMSWKSALDTKCHATLALGNQYVRYGTLLTDLSEMTTNPFRTTTHFLLRLSPAKSPLNYISLAI